MNFFCWMFWVIFREYQRRFWLKAQMEAFGISVVKAAVAAKHGLASVGASVAALWHAPEVVGVHLHSAAEYVPYAHDTLASFLPPVSCAMAPAALTEETLGVFANIPFALNMLAVIDGLALVAVVASYPWFGGAVCDAPLRAWLMGGLLLGFPASAFVDRVGRHSAGGFRGAFVAELVLTAISFAWLAIGTSWLTQARTCMDVSPFLWWTCYTLNVSMWSLLGTMIFFVVISTVISTVMDVNSKGKN